MKFTNKTQNKSIYSPISPEYSPISADESSSFNVRRKTDKNHKKRVDDREYSRRVYKDERYGRSRDRYERKDRSNVRYEKSRDRSEKYDCDVRSRHRSSSRKRRHDRHERSSQRDHKKSDRSKERSRKKCKSKRKKHQKKKHRSSSKSSTKSSSDSDDDLKSSSFISEILKNKKTKNSEKVLDEVRQTINNELNEENISYTPPLKPEMTKIEDVKSCDAERKKISDIKKCDTKLTSNGNKSSLDENGNVSFTYKNAQKSTAVPKSTPNNVSQAKITQNDVQKLKVNNANHVTSTSKTPDVQKTTVSNGNHMKVKSVLDLPMPPDIDIPITPSPTRSYNKYCREMNEKGHQTLIEPIKKASDSVIVSIPLAKLHDYKDIVPIIATNFENSQLKKGVISHPPVLLPQPKEIPLRSNHGDRFKDMQKKVIPHPPSFIPLPKEQSQSSNHGNNFKEIQKHLQLAAISLPPEIQVQSSKEKPLSSNHVDHFKEMQKGVIPHPTEFIPLPKEKPLSSNHGEHFKEMQKHLQKGSIFTPFDPKGTPPEFAKPARASVIKRPTLSSTRLNNQAFDNFQILEQVGKGTYGKVFKAIDLQTHETVAMKYIKVDHETEGFPITCLREIKILRQLDHPNIIKLRDIVFRHEKNSTYLVFDYMNHDLLGLRINTEMKFSETNVFLITKQILEGINYCHKNQIIHRDLKLSNILVNNKGQVKICDFGLSRMWTVNRPYTNKVISLWYRPIELLLGEEMYGPPVDIWSIGCIIFELFRRQPLFNFNTELEVVNAIYQLCGTPEFNMWPEVKRLPKYKTFKARPRMRTLKNTLFPSLPPTVIDLVDQMLALNPAKRITAEDALKSNWIVKMGETENEPIKLPKMDSLEMRARGF